RRGMDGAASDRFSAPDGQPASRSRQTDQDRLDQEHVDQDGLDHARASAAQAAYVEGLRALRDGAVGRAIPLLQQAVAHLPADPGRRRNLVRALLAGGQYSATVCQAQDGLRHAPDDAELHFALGSALAELGQTQEAATALTRALTLRPGHAPTWLNLANLLVDQDDLPTAETLCRTALDLDPALPEAQASLGYMLTRQGRLTEAVAACDAAIRLRPDFAQAHWNRAIALLLDGELRAGFAAYEWRKRHAHFTAAFPALPGPAWDGSSPAGRTILLRAEQGAGDTIQFARYLRLIRDAGGTPVLACANALAPLFRGMNGCAVAAACGPWPRYDAWADLASLPLLFGTTLETIPLAAGYLAAEPERAARWRSRLPGPPAVGIAFAGNRQHTGDRRRSVPPTLLAPLLAMPGITFINVQHGPEAGALGLPDLTAQLPDYAETAALMSALDLVITVDTSVAHLAAALGVRTWIMLPHAPDWRWMLGRSDTAWYDSVRLYRQPVPGAWDHVIAAVAGDLAGWMSARMDNQRRS
ncbi:MAG TPA: tetratricopeptide repeat protein, partial [Rhodopila sp.]|nr:tetratricopeptide repeat protein [Rhodopila sp.]